MALKFLRRWPWSQLPEPPDPQSFRPASILLASEGGRIPAQAVEFAVRAVARIQGAGPCLHDRADLGERLRPAASEPDADQARMAGPARIGGGGRGSSEAPRGRCDGQSRQQQERRQAHTCRVQAAWARRRHRHGGASAAPLDDRQFHLGARALSGAPPGRVRRSTWLSKANRRRSIAPLQRLRTGWTAWPSPGQFPRNDPNRPRSKSSATFASLWRGDDAPGCGLSDLTARMACFDQHEDGHEAGACDDVIRAGR